jgi:hypothetical protein
MVEKLDPEELVSFKERLMVNSIQVDGASTNKMIVSNLMT